MTNSLSLATLGWQPRLLCVTFKAVVNITFAWTKNLQQHINRKKIESTNVTSRQASPFIWDCICQALSQSLSICLSLSLSLCVSLSAVCNYVWDYAHSHGCTVCAPLMRRCFTRFLSLWFSATSKVSAAYSGANLWEFLAPDVLMCWFLGICLSFWANDISWKRV